MCPFRDSEKNTAIVWGCDYSPAVEHLPPNQDVMGSNPAGCCSFLSSLSPSQCVVDFELRVPKGEAALLISQTKFMLPVQLGLKYRFNGLATYHFDNTATNLFQLNFYSRGNVAAGGTGFESR